jgi:hypothetical protein
LMYCLIANKMPKLTDFKTNQIINSIRVESIKIPNYCWTNKKVGKNSFSIRLEI